MSNQFVYILKPKKELLDEKNWTKKEEEIVSNHFFKLQELLKEKKLILAGKTSGLDEKPLVL